MTPEGRDFRNCGWSGRTRNLTEAYFCNKKRLQLREADLGIGICPCSYWIHASQRRARPAEGARKGLRPDPTLVREPKEG